MKNFFLSVTLLSGFLSTMLFASTSFTCPSPKDLTYTNGQYAATISNGLTFKTASKSMYDYENKINPSDIKFSIASIDSNGHLSCDYYSTQPVKVKLIKSHNKVVKLNQIWLFNHTTQVKPSKSKNWFKSMSHSYQCDQQGSYNTKSCPVVS